jgi:hypothetical protein
MPSNLENPDVSEEYIASIFWVGYAMQKPSMKPIIATGAHRPALALSWVTLRP